MGKKKRLSNRALRKVPTCYKCGQPIMFSVLPSGKYKPVNLDGSDHWDICKATTNSGKPFDPARDTRSSRVITGSQYVELPPLPEGVAPWD